MLRVCALLALPVLLDGLAAWFEARQRAERASFAWRER